jgi:hypothetical protein
MGRAGRERPASVRGRSVVRLSVAAMFCACAQLAPPCLADPTETERQTQRELMERDRQAAEFSRPELRDMPQRGYTGPFRPDERALRARERDDYSLQHQPVPTAPANAPPLPLPSANPGGPVQGVDPIPIQGPRG